MEFIIENFEVIIAGITALLTVTGVIVKYTKNKTDDRIFKIISEGFDFAKDKVSKEDLERVNKIIKDTKNKIKSVEDLDKVAKVAKTTEDLKKIIK